jgi:hypothetical protein
MHLPKGHSPHFLWCFAMLLTIQARSWRSHPTASTICFLLGAPSTPSLVHCVTRLNVIAMRCKTKLRVGVYGASKVIYSLPYTVDI